MIPVPDIPLATLVVQPFGTCLPYHSAMDNWRVHTRSPGSDNEKELVPAANEQRDGTCLSWAISPLMSPRTETCSCSYSAPPRPQVHPDPNPSSLRTYSGWNIGLPAEQSPCRQHLDPWPLLSSHRPSWDAHIHLD